ncbi:MAG: hypothetical protein JSW08_00810 [archaeon]|nr:MAG: hypothetical protein JSW08_00810 [archaeon]
MKKGQVTIEFTLLVSAVIFLVVIMIASANFNTSLAREKNEQESLNDFANFLQQEITLASGSPPNYSREFTLPKKITGKEYSILMSDSGYGFVVKTLRGSETKFTASRGTPYINDVEPLIPGGTVTIEKIREAGEQEELKLDCQT